MKSLTRIFSRSFWRAKEHKWQESDAERAKEDEQHNEACRQFRANVTHSGEPITTPSKPFVRRLAGTTRRRWRCCSVQVGRQAARGPEVSPIKWNFREHQYADLLYSISYALQTRKAHRPQSVAVGFACHMVGKSAGHNFRIIFLTGKHELVKTEQQLMNGLVN